MKKYQVKKEEFNKIVKEVDEKLVLFLKNGNYKDVLLKMGNLSKYSLLNQIYILIQYPNASYVSGIKGWNYLKRSVKKKEKGIRIISPIVNTIKKEDEGNDLKIINGYKSAFVFDISQTIGKEIKTFKLDENVVIENKDLIISALKNVLNKVGYHLDYKNKEYFEEGCLGLCDHKNKTVVILDSLCDLNLISTMTHETAHAILHSPYKNDFKGLRKIPKRDIKEVEAESVSCIVCSHLGLDTKDFSFSYITGWADGDIKKFRENLSVISNCAYSLIKEISESINKGEKEYAKLGN